MTHNEILIKKEKGFLTSFIPKTSYFYRLTKIRKLEEIRIAFKTQRSENIEIPKLNDLKFRPTDAGSSSPTNRHSKLIHILP